MLRDIRTGDQLQVTKKGAPEEMTYRKPFTVMEVSGSTSISSRLNEVREDYMIRIVRYTKPSHWRPGFLEKGDF